MRHPEQRIGMKKRHVKMKCVNDECEARGETWFAVFVEDGQTGSGDYTRGTNECATCHEEGSEV